MQTERVSLFVDSANMNHACKRVGFYIDWKKTREFFVKDREFGTAYFYYAVQNNANTPSAASDNDRQRFLDFLSYNGYVVRVKNTKTFETEGGNSRYQKANLTIEIATDMLTTSEHWDVAYVFSGDGDFERVVEILRARGKKIYIVTAEGMLARELAYAADKPIIWIDNIKNEIGRTDRRPEEDAPSENAPFIQATVK